MNENEIEYRGSKSELKNFVKEQRVDVGYPLEGDNSQIRPSSRLRIGPSRGLRCTLKGFERNYQVRNPSRCNFVGFNPTFRWVKNSTTGTAALQHSCSKQLTKRFNQTLVTVPSLLNP